jgi:hypothetical protein
MSAKLSNVLLMPIYGVKLNTVLSLNFPPPCHSRTRLPIAALPAPSTPLRKARGGRIFPPSIAIPVNVGNSGGAWIASEQVERVLLVGKRWKLDWPTH